MSSRQNDNPMPPKGERIMKKRRGRPQKSSNNEASEEPHSIVKHVRFSPSEWAIVESKMNGLGNGNFSAYARRILMGIKPVVIESKVTEMLRAARKDMVSFINAVSGMKLNAVQRKQLLVSIPTLAEWWPKLEKEIIGINNFLDLVHKKGFYSTNNNKETGT